MKVRNSVLTLAVGLVAGIGLLATLARAETYPARTITLIVPFPPGGPSDVVARIISDGMSRQLNQTVIIENVGGAGGTIGTARVAAATPDGYTLLAAGMGSHVAAPVLTPNIRYDWSRISSRSGSSPMRRSRWWCARISRRRTSRNSSPT